MKRPLGDLDAQRENAYAEEAKQLRRQLVEFMLERTDSAPFETAIRQAVQAGLHLALLDALKRPDVAAAFDLNVGSKVVENVRQQLDDLCRGLGTRVQDELDQALNHWLTNELEQRLKNEVDRRLKSELERRLGTLNTQVGDAPLAAAAETSKPSHPSGSPSPVPALAGPGQTGGQGAGRRAEPTSKDPGDGSPGPRPLKGQPQDGKKSRWKPMTGWKLAGVMVVVLALLFAGLFALIDAVTKRGSDSREEPRRIDTSDTSRDERAETFAERQADDEPDRVATFEELWERHLVPRRRDLERIPALAPASLDDAFGCWFSGRAAQAMGDIAAGGFWISPEDLSSRFDSCVQRDYPVMMGQPSLPVWSAQALTAELTRATNGRGACGQALAALKEPRPLQVDGIKGPGTVIWLNALLNCHGVNPAYALAEDAPADRYVLASYVALQALGRNDEGR